MALHFTGTCGRAAIRAIRRREGLVVITPLAQLVWRFKRFAPGLFDWLQQFRRHRRRPTVAAPVASPLLWPNKAH